MAAASHARVAGNRSALKRDWPGREKECSRLYELLGDASLALPLYVHGPSGCGKSAVLRATLETLKVPTAYLDCVAMSSAEQLFNNALNQLAGHRPSVQNGFSSWAVCDSVGAFVLGLRHIVQEKGRVVLVFDKAERLAARGASQTLLNTLLELPSLFAAAGIPGAAGAVLPVFVGESLWPNFQRLCEGDSRLIHFRFAGYPKGDLETVIKRDLHVALPEHSVIRRKLEHRASLDPSGKRRVLADDHVEDDEYQLAPPPPQEEDESPAVVHQAAFDKFVTGFVDTFTEVSKQQQQAHIQQHSPLTTLTTLTTPSPSLRSHATRRSCATSAGSSSHSTSSPQPRARSTSTTIERYRHECSRIISARCAPCTAVTAC